MDSQGITGDGRLTELRHYAAVRLMSRSRRIETQLRNAADMLKSANRADDFFQVRLPFETSRRGVWKKMIERLPDAGGLKGFEFGVGQGEATRWWLRNFQDPSLSWYAFDTFTGNPETWREHEKGTWNAYGLPPSIDDPRCSWVVGDVFETSEFVSTSVTPDDHLVILMDLNLKEPTSHVVEILSDLSFASASIYFDDFFDPAQARIAVSLAKRLRGCRPIARSAKSLAFSTHSE